MGYVNYRNDKKGANIKLDEEELKVKLPTVPGTETLDSVDIADATSNVLSNVQRIIQDYVDTLTEAPPEVDKKVLLNVLNDKIEPILGKRPFDTSKIKEKIQPIGTESLRIEKMINKRLLEMVNNKKEVKDE